MAAVAVVVVVMVMVVPTSMRRRRTCALPIYLARGVRYTATLPARAPAATQHSALCQRSRSASALCGGGGRERSVVIVLALVADGADDDGAVIDDLEQRDVA